MLVGWTGHRPDVFRDPAAARETVARAAAEAAARWPGCEFVLGGQRGVDCWAAQAALATLVPFHILLPTSMDRFSVGWDELDRDELRELLERAASVELADPDGQLGALAYDLRSERVVQRADLLVAVWTGLRWGGTFHTICAARARGVPLEEHLLDSAAPVWPGRGL